MHVNARSRLVFAGLLAGIAACSSQTEPTASSGSRPGQVGATFLVRVQRPEHGTLSSGADGRINCGSAPTATICGPAAFAWTETATLVATADAGYMLGTFVGDCSGRPTNAAGEFVCVLDTTLYGHDKFVGAVFGPTGRVQHTNFTSPAVHGPEFLKWIAKAPDAYECTYCHGATYGGRGLALSCNECHARAGFASWQTNCNFCHTAPPLMEAMGGTHPDTSTDVRTCAVCHPTTVDGTGTIVAGGTHMNGQLDGGGHGDGYAAPALHGRDFFASVAAGSGSCTVCHGATYADPIADGDRSCNSCHADSGWVTLAGTPNWQTNCSFCHGVKDAATQGRVRCSRITRRGLRLRTRSRSG